MCDVKQSGQHKPHSEARFREARGLAVQVTGGEGPKQTEQPYKGKA